MERGYCKIGEGDQRKDSRGVFHICGSTGQSCSRIVTGTIGGSKGSEIYRIIHTPKFNKKFLISVTTFKNEYSIVQGGDVYVGWNTSQLQHSTVSLLSLNYRCFLLSRLAPRPKIDQLRYAGSRDPASRKEVRRRLRSNTAAVSPGSLSQQAASDDLLLRKTLEFTSEASDSTQLRCRARADFGGSLSCSPALPPLSPVRKRYPPSPKQPSLAPLAYVRDYSRAPIRAF